MPTLRSSLSGRAVNVGMMGGATVAVAAAAPAGGAGGAAASAGAVIDLVFGGADAPSLTRLRNDGAGGFSAGDTVSFAEVSGGFSDAAVADVNRDGIADVVATNAGARRIVVAFGEAGGALRVGPSSVVGAEPGRLVLRDVTADGVPDAVIATDRGAAVLRGRGDGGFEPLAAIDLGAAASDLLVTDVTGDGIDDLILATPEQHRVHVLRGDGGGRFAPASTINGSAPIALAAGDFTGDGRTDVVIADAGDQTLRVFPGGAIGLGSPATVTSDVPAARLIGADMNADGLADLVALDTVTGSVRLLLGRGDGTFESSGRLEVGESTRGIAVADLNGDRLPDVVLTAPAAQAIVVGTNTSPVQVRVGDLNGDGGVGVTDLNQLVAELFDGDGSSAESCRGGSVASGAEADVNGDGVISAADAVGLPRLFSP